MGKFLQFLGLQEKPEESLFNVDKYIYAVEELFGFKLTEAGRKSLDFRVLEGNESQIAVSTITAAVAWDYNHGRKLKRLQSAHLFIVGAIKNLEKLGLIGKEQSDFSVSVVSVAQEDELNQEAKDMFNILMAENDFTRTHGPAKLPLCLPDLENNKWYQKTVEIVGEGYKEYLKSNSV